MYSFTQLQSCRQAAFFVAIKQLLLRSTDKGEWCDGYNLILSYQYSKTVAKTYSPVFQGYPALKNKGTGIFENMCY